MEIGKGKGRRTIRSAACPHCGRFFPVVTMKNPDGSRNSVLVQPIAAEGLVPIIPGINAPPEAGGLVGASGRPLKKADTPRNHHDAILQALEGKLECRVSAPFIVVHESVCVAQAQIEHGMESAPLLFDRDQFLKLHRQLEQKAAEERKRELKIDGQGLK